MITAQDAETVGGLISAAGGSSFGQALDLLTKSCAEFDMSCAFAFSLRAEPKVVHDGYSATVDRRALRSYLRGAYLLDPFYSASISGRPEGLWRMRDLAPDGFYESEFMASREVHPCISDEAGTLVEEIGFLVRLTGEHTATYSLMRNRGGQPFCSEEFAALAALTPIVAASLQRHWQLTHATDNVETPVRADAEQVFQEVFGSVLTPAQHAVTKLILRGHSSLSIAVHLGIAEGTVKIHRSNIYRRLEISSQSELFQMFINYLAK
ncbi:helix-turn-helix transcriptional regulator [Leisingera daeponensis]|uniref:helix-turn-helix transcriptional regulator n=1 Tax=Leisingera daeponensis TaxID=405746 RepID=UPI001C981D6D|nr:LuxR C-terminal-related transcriptional regulator [Leisingera daeponensis]MBY6058725.1 LuxR C-terminal-related transcriptional regulator [Leisingera daeponensis]